MMRAQHRRRLRVLIVLYLALWLALSDCRAIMRGSDANTASYAPYPENRYPAVEQYIKEIQKW